MNMGMKLKSKICEILKTERYLVHCQWVEFPPNKSWWKFAHIQWNCCNGIWMLSKMRSHCSYISNLKFQITLLTLDKFLYTYCVLDWGQGRVHDPYISLLLTISSLLLHLPTSSWISFDSPNFNLSVQFYLSIGLLRNIIPIMT